MSGPEKASMHHVPIDPQHWAELSRLLDEALELPVSERDQWVATLDSTLEVLKPQLRELLALAPDVETQDFLATLPKLQGLDPGTTIPSPGGQAGERIGPYQLKRELGAGGMGSVWLAERVDGLIQRPVALKLPHVAPAGSGLAERMARERGILSALAHPHIARLYDAGITPEGRPYLALEYVEGQPIGAYCRERQLDGEARLRLFLQVANAVAYAHGKLVIHRDLKPANILVTADGQARLLDFGVAKLLDEERASGGLTELLGRAFTPDYASPEQILGEPLGVATDVYSLGVILFELLTGARPYKLARESRRALEDAIVEREPPRPSEVVEPANRRLLRGDLDTIILKALKKKPEERYETVHALADDVSRFLSNRPVHARPDSALYRMRKFVARNRLPVASAVVVLLAIGAGSALALWQATQAARQRDLARQEQRRAETVKRLLVSVFEEADPYTNGGKALTAVELVRQASRSLAARTLEDPSVRSEISYVLSSSLVHLDDLDGAEELARAALSDAMAGGAADEVAIARARLSMAEILRFRGKVPEMREQLDAVVPVLRRHGSAAKEELFRALMSYAHLEIDAARYDEAIRWTEEALRTGERLFGSGSDQTLEAHILLTLSHTYAGHRDAALKAGRHAHDLAEAAHGADSLHPQVIDARFVHARALDLAGELDRSIELQKTSLAAVERAWGPDSVKAGFQSQTLAATQLRAGQLDAAVESAGRTIAILRDTFEPASYSNVAMWNTYARALLYSRRGPEALAALETVTASAGAVFGTSHRNTFEARAHHAMALALTGNLDRAAREADAVLADVRAAGEVTTHRPAHVRGFIARLDGDARAAIGWQLEASGVDSSLSQPAERAAVLAELGLARLGAGSLQEAAADLRQALALLDEAGHDATPVRADVHAGLAAIEFQQQRYAQALDHARKADDFWRGFDPDNRWAGEAAYWLARCQQALGQDRLAAVSRSRARAVLSRSPFGEDALRLKSLR